MLSGILLDAFLTVFTIVDRNLGIRCQKGIGMRFCTVINCMDGRVQLPVIRYMQKRFNAEYVDSITEPGPNLILSEQKSDVSIQSILERLKISIEHHNSVGVAVVGHHGCAGNPALQEDQIAQIHKAIHFLRKKHKNIVMIGLWIDENWEINEIIDDEPGGQHGEGR